MKIIQLYKLTYNLMVKQYYSGSYFGYSAKILCILPNTLPSKISNFEYDN